MSTYPATIPAAKRIESIEIKLTNTPASLRKRLLNPYGLTPRALLRYHVLVLSLAILSLDRNAPFRVYPRADATEVVVIGPQTCPHSRAMRARLTSEHIPFREIDSAAKPFDSALASWAFQTFRLPIVVVDPDVIYENRTEQIDEALVRRGFNFPANANGSSALAVEQLRAQE